MERFFCFGKKDFCDSELCSLDCEFCDDSGGIEGNNLEIIFERIFGKDYDLSRLRELVQADREGRCVVLPISTPAMAYTVDIKSGRISSGFYQNPGAVLHDTERGYIVAKTREAAEEALKGEKHG